MAFLKLTYPIWAASFDPYNNDFLFVGGGGGEGHSGVPNKITLLDVSKKDVVSEVAHIDLPKEEDSVQSLNVAHSSDSSAILYAGINSSLAAQEVGNNEHLRAVQVPYPPKKRNSLQPQAAKPPKALSKASIFTPKPGPRQETYQKVLRLSPARTDIETRLGAIATRDAPEGELVLFDASKLTPAKGDVLHRIALGSGQEAGDVDILEASDDGYLVAYCTSSNIQLIEITPNGQLKETRVFEGSKQDGSFRSLRFLDRNHLLLVRNAPRKSGAQLLILHIPAVDGRGTVIFGKGLHAGFNAALAADVARLPAAKDSSLRQYIAAVAGQDGSLVLFTIDQNKRATRQMELKQHSLLRDLHPAGITSLNFSQFKLPHTESSTRPSKLKLASTSFGNTVVVHTFPLRPGTTGQQTLAAPRQRTPGDSALTLTTGALLVAIAALLIQAITELQGFARHELFGIRQWAPLEIKYLFDIPADPRDMGVPAHQWENHPAISATADAAALAYAQSIANEKSASSKADRAAAVATAIIQGEIDEAIANMKDAASDIPSAEDVQEALRNAGAVNALEEITQRIAEVPQKMQNGAQKVLKVPEHVEQQRKDAFEKIRSLLHAHHRKNEQPADVKIPGALVFQDSEHGLTLTTHEHESHLGNSEVKKWEELDNEERHLWRKRLSEAGHWAEGQSEMILKGVFFGTVAGLVGAAVRV